MATKKKVSLKKAVTKPEKATKPPRKKKTVKAKAVKKEKKLEAKASLLKTRLNAIAKSARESLGENVEGRQGRKIEKQILKALVAIDRLESCSAGEKKPCEKKLKKADKRLSLITFDDPLQTRKEIKKARKAIEKLAGE